MVLFLCKCLKTHQRVYTDDDYVSVMKNSRKKNPFTVTKLKREDFFSVAPLEDGITNRKKDVQGNKINWLSFREIELLKDKPLSMLVRTAFNGTQHEVNISKKKVGRPTAIFSEDLPLLWPEGKPLSAPKLKDLKSMMVFIPSDAKGFYKNFFSNPDVEDDVEGFNGDLDFDVEFE